jgi:hypothetical protein
MALFDGSFSRASQSGDDPQAGLQADVVPKVAFKISKL